AKLLRHAVNQYNGEVNTWGVQMKTLTTMREAGVVEIRHKYTEDKRKVLKFDIETHAETARDLLTGGLDTWQGALKHLQKCEDSDKQMNQQAYFVTDKGREYLANNPE